MNRIFSVGQIVRLVGKDTVGKIVNVDVNRNNDTIYQIQILHDEHKRWFLARDLELYHHMEL